MIHKDNFRSGTFVEIQVQIPNSILATRAPARLDSPADGFLVFI